MGQEAEPQIETLIIHYLDQNGLVVKVEWEPAIYLQERKKNAKQTVNLLDKAGALLHVLATWDEPEIENDQRRAGYRIAIDQVKSVSELILLREAMTDLRGTLRFAVQGVRFPCSAEMNRLEAIPEDRGYRRVRWAR